MSRFQAIGNYVYEKGERIGCTPEEAADAVACKLNAYQMRIERLKAEVERLRASSFVTAVPCNQYEALREAGDELWFCLRHGKRLSVAEIQEAVEDWQVAREGKPSV